MFFESTCPICGRQYERTDEWAYKRGGIFYCSWKCLRKATVKPDGRKTRKYTIHPDSFTFHGITHTLREWAELTGMPYRKLYMRMYYNKPIIMEDEYDVGQGNV